MLTDSSVKAGKSPYDYDTETDLQAFVNLYKKFGIDCRVNVLSDRQTIIIGDSEYLFKNTAKDGEYWTWAKDKIEGYDGFYTVITFDLEGKFISQGVWE
jgi:hypothetical protein